ncbi:MAG: D-2-hydroxyacid dehydrogenase, partial [Halobacteriales archaeon]|nr:D-2-hydroxyacid dehydrogenase [Halobacteriales archaeon]
MSDTDSATDPDIVVLRAKAHGISTAGYAEAIRERLPEYTVRRAATPAEERELIRSATVATGMEVDEEVLENAEQLRLFAGGAAGVDHLPMDQLKAHDVTVTNAAGVHVPTAAEHAIAGLLVLARRFDQAFRNHHEGHWRHFQTHGELADATVTVVGLGTIGTRVAELLQAFGSEVIGVRHTPAKGGPADEVVGYDHADLHGAFARSDYVVLACPLTETTRGLVDWQAFRTLPTDAALVNIARGPVIDTDALVAALRDNLIRGAVLDVTDPEPLPDGHPLWGMDEVVVTPHVAGHTHAYWERIADVLARNLARVEET